MRLTITGIFHPFVVQAQTVPVPPGLVAWWSGEGNANDRLGSSNGTLAPGTTFVAGKVGQAFSLDGSREGVILGRPAALALQNLTFEAWVKRTSPTIATLDNPNWSGVLLAHGPAGYAFVLLPNGQLGFGQSTVNEVTSGSLLAVTDTNWHHVAVTKSGTTVVFYVDGVSKTVLGYSNVFTFGNLAGVGRDGYTELQSFYGSIDEMSVYNRALSAAEIQAIAAAPGGKAFTFTEVGASAEVNDAGTGYGMAWGDYDGDGDQDIYIARPNAANLLYRNNGTGSPFTEVHTAAGIAANGSACAGVWGDYDNDSDLDLYVVNCPNANPLYRNNGNGTFTDVASFAGVINGGNSQTATWGDYNNDGYLDLFVCNYNMDEKLYRNNGNGTFTDAASTVGLATTVPGTYTCAWGDYDSDGDLDLYVTGMSGVNTLFRNDMTTVGRFTDVGVAVNAWFTGFVQGVAWGDYDNDQDLDLFMGRQNQPPVLLRNDGTAGFTDVAANAGISFTPSNWRGLNGGWGDYDNDGYLDLYIPGLLFHNNRNGTFTEAGSSKGVFYTINTDGGGAAWADYDNDGDLDIYAVAHASANRLYRNNGNANHWLHVKLVGTVSNKSGIGARVTAVTGSLHRRQDVEGGSGFFGQPSLPVEFGLGSAGVVDQLTINWPSGIVQTLTNVAADQMLTVVETAAYTLTSSAGAGGSISPLGAIVVSNSGNQTFTITPDAGYHIADVLVDGVSVGAVSNYSFSSVVAAHTISASFAVDTYTITSSAEAGGSISPSGVISVNHGGDQAFDITPDAGYHIAEVLVDGVSVGSVSSHSFSNVTANHTIATSFVDQTPPTLTLNGANPLLLELGTPFVDPGATASDLVDGDISANIQISGTVDVDTEGSNTLTYTVRDAAGNSASATRTVKVVVTPNGYGLIATHSLHLRQSARVHSGFVGVVNRGVAPFLAGRVELVVGTNVQTGPQVRLSAPRVRVRKGANIAGELAYNELVSVDRRTTIADREQVPPSYFPLFQGFGLPIFQTGTPGTQDVEVRQKGSATFSAGAYDEVRVKQKGTLTFTGGTYQLGDLEVGQQAKVIFLAPTTLLIRGQLSLDQKSSFGPGSGIGAADILVYVEGRNGRLGSHHDDDEGDDEEDDADGRRLRKSPRSVKVGEQASFQGNLYAPNGTIHLRQGSTAVGAFIARDIIVGVRVQVAVQSGWNTPGVIYQPQVLVALAKLAGAQGEAATLPGGTGLLANYPNPFNPSTAIPYVLAEVAPVRLSVYNVLGQQIRVLVDQLQVPGTYTVAWDGLDAAGQRVAGGVYFYRLETGEQHAVGRMLLLK